MVRILYNLSLGFKKKKKTANNEQNKTLAKQHHTVTMLSCLLPNDNTSADEEEWERERRLENPGGKNKDGEVKRKSGCFRCSLVR